MRIPEKSVFDFDNIFSYRCDDNFHGLECIPVDKLPSDLRVNFDPPYLDIEDEGGRVNVSSDLRANFDPPYLDIDDEGGRVSVPSDLRVNFDPPYLDIEDEGGRVSPTIRLFDM